MNREKMTIDEAMAIIRKEYLCVDRDCDIEQNCGKCDLMMPSKEPILEAYKMAIKALEQMPTKEEEALLQKWRDNRGISMEEFEDAMNTLDQEPCEDAISRTEAVRVASGYCHPANVAKELAKLPPVNPQPCEDAISRQAVLDVIKSMSNVNPSYWNVCDVVDRKDLIDEVEQLLPVIPQPKTEHCKDCKHFEYDNVARVDGIPLIVAHEICSRWGDGCKTSEDGYCFLFEPQESEDKDADKKCTYKETGCGSCKRQLDCPIEADKAESEDNT